MKKAQTADRLLTRAIVQEYLAAIESELNSTAPIRPERAANLRQQRDAFKALLENWPEGILP